MDEKNDLKELKDLRYGSFPEIFNAMRSMADRYGDLPVDAMIGAFGNVLGYGGRYMVDDPYTQNRRVKGISTRPASYGKDQIAQMLQNPEGNEQPLRAVENALEYTAYPLFHTRMLYQSLTDKDDAKKDDFWREWKLLEKLRKKLNPKDTCHMITGQALKEGKVFYYPRIKVDRSHNKIDHAFLQQMPSDYIKIVGFNNISKYTVAFDLMYFMMPGTDIRQFGDLFLPYIGPFREALIAPPEGLGKKIVYAAIDMDVVRKWADPRVEVYYQNGRWCYWVTLPVDKVFPFEIDDTNRNVLPMFAGLFIDMIQLSQLEQIQLSLLQNPLIQILTGEIPYWDDKVNNAADEYKLSNAGRLLFTSLWYQMLQANNTEGIGLFMAPLKNMKMESVAEVPGAINIVSQGYQDTVAKSGLSAIMPSTAEARAGAVQISFQIESRLPQAIYRCYERMMAAIIENMNLKYEWDFRMFGSIPEDEDLEKSLKEQMMAGILPATIKYDALHDMSFLDDIAISDAVVASEVMDRRLPLVSSYQAQQGSGNLPPQGGRPKSEGVTSEGQEGDLDTKGE